ncbi:HK97 family phage prohead protease [Capnocytophaga sp. oral taxon 326]|uniref:HK97 family phage prohead protease n=1 Tax=Capnocytophaga sp. oral taxon 326 TaxID=712212 RepID=UPI0002A247E2|nr:HK97 family phage prohead protease [Capnocytophaga sp. oral taxon 326]EKY22826.1 putative caudovirus prohead protease [Capnocytophaga sp. oral taxon 326 str. F0382]
MPKFILNDEAVVNSYGFRILTAGIDLTRFKLNPVMLDGHIQSNQNVIGSWKDITLEGGKLLAEPIFDMEDDNAKLIAGKVERGIIKGASMGIMFSKKDLANENGDMVLKNCSLFEVSIVAVPSNANALRLQMDGKELTEKEINELCLSLTDKTINTDNNMKIQLTQLALVALGMSANTKELSTDEIESAILALSKSRDELQEKLTLSEEQLNAFINKEKAQKAALTIQMLDEAVKSGKITADKRQTFADLAAKDFDLAEATFEALPTKKKLWYRCYHTRRNHWSNYYGRFSKTLLR